MAWLMLHLLDEQCLPPEYRTSCRVDALTPWISQCRRAVFLYFVNQGLFYPHWLLKHRAEYRKLVDARLGRETGAGTTCCAQRKICTEAECSIATDMLSGRTNRRLNSSGSIDPAASFSCWSRLQRAAQELG